MYTRIQSTFYGSETSSRTSSDLEVLTRDIDYILMNLTVRFLVYLIGLSVIFTIARRLSA